MAESRGTWKLWLAFAIAIAIVVLRRPDALLHAQFYAEDGRIWFADAYNRGWLHALVIPYAGYLQTLPRLAAGSALLVPLRLAPLVMNCMAIVVAALPAALLLARRAAPWGSLPFRCALAAVYLALPNAWEIGCGITEAQWMLALAALLVLMAEPPQTRAARLSDAGLLLLCGLTGPFCFLLLPIALYRAPRLRWHIAPLALACCAQGAAMLTSLAAARAHPPLAPSVEWLLRILGGNVFAGTLIGTSLLTVAPGIGYVIFFAVLSAACIAAMAICAAKATWPMRTLLAFSAALFVLALLSPFEAQATQLTGWRKLAMSPGTHYWFFPSLAFAWSIAWLAAQRGGRRALGIGLACLLCIGVVRDWRRPVLADLHFAERVADRPQAGQLTIPINPAGWQMTLSLRR